MIVYRNVDASEQDDAFLGARGPQARVAFCTLWTTGGDTTVDGVLRVQALRAGCEPGAWESFDELCNPFPGSGELGQTPAHAERAFGLTPAEVAGAPAAVEVWPRLRAFVAGCALVVDDSVSFAAWNSHLSSAADEDVVAIDLAQIAALLFPGRSASSVGEPDPRSNGPLELQTALEGLVQRFLERDENILRLALAGFGRAWRGMHASAPRAAAHLRLALTLVDQPAGWSRSDARSLAHEGTRLRSFQDEIAPEDLLAELRPACAEEAQRWANVDSLPPDSEEPLPFDAGDRALLDAIFEQHLPAQFARESGEPIERTYRAGQHAVARQVADTLGARELLLVHAPTGTGKTLAYLVPALLWSQRYGVRVGIATYTRALQEQALEREVPRALKALSQAGVVASVRVCVLKGRDNYLCWRALKLALPDEGDAGEDWLAWTVLVLFALGDVDGDLDRLPQRSPLPIENAQAYQRSAAALVRQVRGQPACCTHRDDRECCAAEVARRKAERCHVVIINQAFALARQEFFKHVIFDECEHLHDQAHSAFSHVLNLRLVRALFARLHHPARGNPRATLDRMQRMLLEGTPAHATLVQTRQACEQATDALERLERAVLGFDAWREDHSRARNEREAHSLLREFVIDHDARELLESRCAFAQGLSAVETSLAELSERLDSMPLRGLPGLRRNLDLARTGLQELLVALDAWIPLDEGRPVFRPRTFHDVERDARNDLVLASRVLLPNEFLGRNYYPQLATGVFLSATTWLQDSFEPAQGYLGLDRAAHPAPDEEREARVLRCFRAPDVFDYSRVLIAVPRDAPSVSADKEAFLEYVRRFLAYLGERTRGRMLVLFTNAADTKRTGEDLAGFFRARRIPLWFQNMEGTAKEELGELFRARIDSVLLGVDTFWYGADFPGETLEYLVIVKLPYGVPDRYHHAQCAVLGEAEQRRRIYLPKALAKFRQGFGRLMRRVSDRGCVFVLDGRVLDARHRFFLRELPIRSEFEPRSADGQPANGARLVRADTDRCVQEALAHMGLAEEVQRRGLGWSFGGEQSRPATGARRAGGDGGSPAITWSDAARAAAAIVPQRAPSQVRGEGLDEGSGHGSDVSASPGTRDEAAGPPEISLEDLPY